MSKIAENVYTHITPALHPSNIEQIKDYEQHKGYLNGVLESLSVTYEGLAEVHKARLAAEKNVTMNDPGRLIVVGNYAEKKQDAIARKIDATMANLNKGIDNLEDMLSTPIKSAASTGTIPTEIRAHVKSLSLEARHKFLNDAQRAGDTQTLTAVLGAPEYLTGITAAEKVARTYNYHKHNAPEAAKRLEVMKAGRDLLTKRSALVFKEMEKAIGAKWSDLHAVRDAKSKSDAFSVEGV